MNVPTHKQKGVALLTVLLLVVAITIVAGSMLAKQKLMIRQYDLLLTQDQLLQDIHAGEQLAAALILVDSQLTSTDSLQDAWAQPLAPYQLGDHEITLTLRDESSRFNINNLYHDATIDDVALAVFQRLLTQLELEADLAYAVVDWQDPDNELSSSDGLENELYSNANTDNEPSVVIANQPFLSIDELLQVDGFDLDSFNVLKPYITAVPYYLPINVNTASPVLLAALTKDAKVSDYTNNDTVGQRQIFNSVDEFMQTLPDSGESKSKGESESDKNDNVETESAHNKKDIEPLLSIYSQAFAVLIDVRVDDKHRYATSYISKIDKIKDDDNPDSPTQALLTPLANTHSDMQIQPFAMRLWAYHPVFEP